MDGIAEPAITPSEQAAFAPRHVYLMDGSGFIFRAFHALPPLNRADGTPINAVLGFCNILAKLVQETDADCIAVIFDAARTTFRNRIYENYKANRSEPPPELIPQFALVRAATEAFNLAQIELPDYEADDLIATYARLATEAGAKVTIVSSDKDLMQLVGERVEMFDPMKSRVIGPAEVREKFCVGPERVVDVQALCGDSIDNVPGVPGIGIKTAAELINTYGDLDTLLARAGEIKQPKRRQCLIDYADQARISRELVQLKNDVPPPMPLSDLALRAVDYDKLVNFFRSQGLRQLAGRFEARAKFGDAKSGGTAPPSEPASRRPDLRALPAQLGVHVSKEPGEPIERRYELIQTTDALQRWIARATELGAVALDTETSALDAVQAELIGIALAVGPGDACYIPLAHVTLGADQLDLTGGQITQPEQIPTDQALVLLRPLLEDPGVLKIAHNAKYDFQVLANYGIRMTPVDCTMLLAFVLGAGLHGMSIDELAERFLDHVTIKYKDVAGSGKNHTGFAAVPLDKALDYAAEDADIALRLHAHLKPRMLQERMATLYETIERPMVSVVADMERAGIKVDRSALQALSLDFGTRMVAFEKEIHALAGEPFNIGSPKQLGEILFDKMSLPGGKKGKTGAYGTDAALLEQLALTHDLPRRVLDWRQLAKLKSTYSDNLVQEIDPRSGRVHTTYSLTGAATGRLSSNDPNLQNIPIRSEEGRKIRRSFVAEEGNVLLSADYSQIELRLAAHVAQVPALVQAFQDGEDIHAMTAAEVFGIPREGMDPRIRRRAKAINFGIIYGISAFGLAQQLSISNGEAGAYIAQYFERFPEIRTYMNDTKEFAREHGYVVTLFGRRCHVPGIKDSNPARRSFSERAAINAPLQGTAADIIKRAMIRLPERLQTEGLKAKMLLQVHDELVFEVPEDEITKASAVIREVMEAAPHPVLEIAVPLVVETGTAANWEEAH